MAKILLQLIGIRRELSEIRKELMAIRRCYEPQDCVLNGKCLNLENHD